MNIPEPTDMCRTDAQWLSFVRGETEKKLEQLAAMRERKEREKQERKAKGRRGEA